MIRQHAGAGLVAAATVTAALLSGLFYPIPYAVGSIAIWAALLAGLLSRALPIGRVAGPAVVAGLCLAGVVVLAGASVAWASDQGRAFEEAVRASAYLGLFVLAACTATSRGRGQWVGGLAVGLAVVSILAVVSRLQPGLLGDRELVQLFHGEGSRLSYPIGYWNALAALLAVAVVLLAYGGAEGPSRGQRATAIAVMPVPLLGLWLTTSRGAALAALVGVGVLVGASPHRPRQIVALLVGAGGGGLAVLAVSRMHSLADGLADGAARTEGDWATIILVAIALLTAALAWLMDDRELRVKVPRRLAVALGVSAALVIVAGIIAVDPVTRIDEFTETPPPRTDFAPAAGSDLAGNGRWQFWGVALDAFEDAPIAGIGAGGYEDWWAQNATASIFVRNPHSLPLQQLAELGLLGGALLIGFMAAVAVAARRRLAAGLDGDGGVLAAVVVVGALSAAVDWSWEFPAVFGPTVVAAGLLTASASGREPKRDSLTLGLSTLAMAWLAMLASGLVLLTELKLEQSRSAEAAGQIEEGIDRALDAHTVQPWSPEPYTQLAVLEETRGNVDEALSRLRQAMSRDSEDWRLYLFEARLHFEKGDQKAGQAAFERARILSPRSPIVGGPEYAPR